MKCIRVRQGDRVGVYLEEAPGSVSFIFDGSDPQSLSHTLANTSVPYATGDKVVFDPLTFPYDFSVAAYVDTDLDKYENETEDRVECPRGLMIPEYAVLTLAPTTRAPITGAAGATGSTGRFGPQGGTGPRGAMGPAGANGVMGFTGATGPMGKDGVMGTMGGTGATGPAGLIGLKGNKGEKGEKGDEGPQGERGPPGPPAKNNSKGENGGPLAAATSSMSAFSDPLIVLICIIWLVVVTILLIVLICVICFVVKHQKRDDDDEEFRHVAIAGGQIGGVTIDQIPLDEYTYDTIDNTAGQPDMNGAIRRDRLGSSKSTKPENDPEWISDMKDITTSQYSVDTITRDGKTIRNKDGSAYVNLGAALDEEAKAADTANHVSDTNSNLIPMHVSLNASLNEALNPRDPDNVSVGNLSREEINMY